MFSWKRLEVDGRSRALSHCPMCLYDLAGLPKNHKCPECGFAYDESMRVWKKQGLSEWEYIVIGIFGIFLLIPSWILLGNSVVHGRSEPKHFLIVLFLTIIFASGLRAMNARVILVVSSEGLLIRGSRNRVKNLAWKEIWVPHPDERCSLPPWSEAKNSAISKKRSGVIKALTRERGVPARFRGVIFKRPTYGASALAGRIALTPILGLPDSARREAMLEIHERWKQALQDRIAHSEDSSPA